MFKSLLFLVAVAAAAQNKNEFVILHAPDSVEFTINEELEQSSLKEILSAALGYTGKLKDSEHSIAVGILDPFNLPEALVAVVIEGVNSWETPKKERFRLNADEVEETTWQAIRARCESRGNNNTLVRISLGDGVNALGQSALGELKPMPIDTLPLKDLDLNKEEDAKFLEEVQLMRAIAKNVPTAIKSDSNPDIYWLVFSGLGPLSEAHGQNSSATKEALSLLSDALNAISDAFIEAYEGRVVITAFTNNATQARHTRSVILERNARNALNLEDIRKIEDTIAPKYDENYPVIFNILLWFGVVFFFSLLAICVAIADMDPGRDSTIYRMTSNRIKKDN